MILSQNLALKGPGSKKRLKGCRPKGKSVKKRDPETQVNKRKGKKRWLTPRKRGKSARKGPLRKRPTLREKKMGQKTKKKTNTSREEKESPRGAGQEKKGRTFQWWKEK